MVVILVFLLSLTSVSFYLVLRGKEKSKKLRFMRMFFFLFSLSLMNAVYLSPYINEDRWFYYLDFIQMGPKSIHTAFYLSLLLSLISAIGYLISTMDD